MNKASTKLALVIGLIVTAPVFGQQTDINGDLLVDSTDVEALLALRNTQAGTPTQDLRDLDGDGTLTILDARIMATTCLEDECAPPVCASPDPEFFSGSYLMEQLSGSDPFFGSETFGDTQVVEIVADGTYRSFNFTYFPGVFDSNYNFTMRLCKGATFMRVSINAGGLGCGGGNIGASSPEVPATHDTNFQDDATVLVDVADFRPDGNCGTGSYPVQLRFTKQ